MMNSLQVCIASRRYPVANPGIVAPTRSRTAAICRQRSGGPLQPLDDGLGVESATRGMVGYG